MQKAPRGTSLKAVLALHVFLASRGAKAVEGYLKAPLPLKSGVVEKLLAAQRIGSYCPVWKHD